MTRGMNDDQLLRYSRHILLDEIGIEGQESCSPPASLVIGAGGLGSPAALYLASAGVGRITLVDDDEVDLTNLQRQVMHTTARVGQPKAESGARRAAADQSRHRGHGRCASASATKRLAELVRGATVVLDCSDNFATRHAVNRACFAAGVPLVSGAVIRFDGQVSVFDPRSAASPCYACLFPQDQAFRGRRLQHAWACSRRWSAWSARCRRPKRSSWSCGIGTSLAGRLLLLDGRAMEWTSIQVAKSPDCPVCNNSPMSHDLQNGVCPRFWNA